MYFLRINRVLTATLTLLLAGVLFAYSSPRAPDAAPALPDFRVYTAGPERKQEFFAFLKPLVRAQNEKLLDERRMVEALAEKPRLGWLDKRRLRQLANHYALSELIEDESEEGYVELLERLQLRVDAVPESLALAQAAKESGWGTSRFAREGNNLFGEWCFDPGCGIVPKARAEGRRHEVEAFESPVASIASYMRNINTHESYRSFRMARRDLREEGARLSGVDLAGELSRYSERRDDYVTELQRLIISNDLESGDAEVAALEPGTGQ